MSKKIEEIKELLEHYEIYPEVYKKEYVEYINGLKVQQQKIEQLEKEVDDLKEITEICCEPTTKELLRLKQENTKLEEMIKEAINLPKGIEPHSYSDYKINKVKSCSCDVPIVRNDGNIDYCGNCGDDLE